MPHPADSVTANQEAPSAADILTLVEDASEADLPEKGLPPKCVIRFIVAPAAVAFVLICVVGTITLLVQVRVDAPMAIVWPLVVPAEFVSVTKAE